MAHKLRCAPLDSSIHGSLMLPGVPRNCTPMALLFRESYYAPDAVLVTVKASGLLAACTNGTLKVLDQKQARAAYDAMRHDPVNSEDVKAELASAIKTWREAAGMTQARAAEVLGMSKRSYEGIEAGRGFVYPQLLMLALKAFE